MTRPLEDRTSCGRNSWVGRRFLAIETRSGPSRCVVIFDPWIEGARSFVGPDGAKFASITKSLCWSRDSRENTDPLIDDMIELIVVGKGAGIWDLDHVSRAPLCQRSEFHSRPGVADSLTAAGTDIRAAIIDALIGGVKSDTGVIHAKIGDAEIAVDPTTAEWLVAHADGCRRSGRNLRRFGLALGAVPDGVLAVRLLETAFRWRIPPKAALAIADAIDGCAPIPKEVRP